MNRRCRRMASSDRNGPTSSRQRWTLSRCLPLRPAVRPLVVVGAAGARKVDQLGVDLQVLAPTVGVGQLRRQGPHQRRRQGTEAARRLRLVLVEHGVAAGVDLGIVLGVDGPHHAVAVAEVVLHGHRVLGARRRG